MTKLYQSSDRSETGSDVPELGEEHMIESLAEIGDPGGTPRPLPEPDHPLHRRHVPKAPLLKGIFDVDQLFGELTWIVTPVFFPSLRAEASREEHDGQFAHRSLGLLTLHHLLRANLDLRVQVGIGAEDDAHPDFRYAGLAFSAAL